MKLALALGIGSLLTLTTSTVTARAGGDTGSAFRAEIVGDVSARPSGAARFGRAGGTNGVPAVFTISLGADAAEGSVLFTRQSGAALVPGTYRISNCGRQRRPAGARHDGLGCAAHGSFSR